MSAGPLSFQELRAAPSAELAPVETLTASDGVALAYRRYAPAAPLAALLFYHGGGAHSGTSYHHFGRGLQQQSTLVVMPDVRGHGASGGPRGDAPSPRQVWDDVTALIAMIRASHPGLPVFLGGHSSGAGLALNYTSHAAREHVDGYVFLAPQFGFRSKTARPAQAVPFARVSVPLFVVNALSGGLLLGHARAVRFSYPADVLAADPALITSITVNMANALTPAAPQRQIAALDRPFGLWIGAEDEVLAAEAVVGLVGLAGAVRAESQAAVLPGVRHLSLLLAAHEAAGPWIAERVAR